MKKSWIVSSLFVIASLLVFSGAHAQTTNGTFDPSTTAGQTDDMYYQGNMNAQNQTGTDTTGTRLPDTGSAGTGTTNGTTGTGTIPGLPDTGAGGNAALTLAMLLGSAAVMAGGAVALRRMAS